VRDPNLPELEVLSQYHIRLNNYLIDMVSIEDWINHNTTGAQNHNLHQTHLSLRHRIMNFPTQKQEKDERLLIWWIQCTLSRLTENGYPLPDDPFLISCGHPFFRGKEERIFPRHIELTKYGGKIISTRYHDLKDGWVEYQEE
jgi:hypothetical protein